MDEKMLDAYKELTPVVYGENAIKYLKFSFLNEYQQHLCMK